VARRRGGKRTTTGTLLLLAVAMLLSGLFAGIMLQKTCAAEKAKTTPKRDAAVHPGGDSQMVGPKTSGPTEPTKRPEVEKQSPVIEAPGPKSQTPRIALVIDDLGQADMALVKRLCDLDIPFTVAVLPFLQHSRDSANLADSKGKEVILHMPMEPVGYPAPGKDPGPGAVLSGLLEPEVRERVKLAMKDIPHAVGLNNHMGSRITPDAEKMAWILGEAKKSNWYFLDSRTEKDTVALEVARRLGVPSMERKVFLDDDPDQAEMTRQWERALSLAGQDGQVVVIGHARPETIAFLESLVPTAKRDVKFVRASELAR